MKRYLLALLLFISLAVPAYAQHLPPTPATVFDAVPASNECAYNGAAHNTVEYWNSPDHSYRNDPFYFWRRMLGWQAEGGPDQALSGPYALPPTPCFTAAPVVVVPPPPPAFDYHDVLIRLEDFRRRLDAAEADHDADVAALRGDLTTLAGRVDGKADKVDAPPTPWWLHLLTVGIK